MEHEVRAFNFTRQYPEFLFPGKTQLVGPEDTAVPIESTALLDTANPFSWGKTAHEIAQWSPDILILRYWMSYFAPSLGYVARRVAKKCGAKVLAIVDNAVPHEPHFFDRPFTSYFLGGINTCIAMCAEVKDDIHSIRPDIPCKVLHHPVYTHFGQRVAREEAEKHLGLEAGKKTLLFFGLIREYKGLDILLEAFETLDDSYQLIIAGEPYGSFDKYQTLIDNSKGRERIHLFPDYIPDEDVRYYFCASDVVVLPYRSATQSGISAIASHFELPMIVSDVGGLRETIGDTKTGIVCDKADKDCVSKAIQSYFHNPGLQEEFITNIKAEKERLSWNRFCKNLLS